jgi:uncharacterized protein YcfJ
MKVATISGVVIAALAAGAIATPSFAQPYGYASDCRQDQRSSATAGTIIGGIAGALLGSNLAAHHGGRSGGAAIGAVTGAVVGNAIGRSSGQSCGYQADNDGYQAPVYSSGYYAQPAYGYAQPAYGYVQPAYGYDARYSYSAYDRSHYDRDRDNHRDGGGWRAHYR